LSVSNLSSPKYGIRKTLSKSWADSQHCCMDLS